MLAGTGVFSYFGFANTYAAAPNIAQSPKRESTCCFSSQPQL
jgi:hypothetical protein